jgi:hypothetical protein
VGGACVTVACVPGTFDCLDGSNQRICRSDGSGYDTVYCGDGLSCVDGHCEEICALRVFILVDQSGSMSDGTPTKWEQAKTAISTLMTSPAASEVEFGFGTFPSDGDCAASDCVTEPIPSATSSIVNSYFTSNGPSGNTPLTFAMQFFETDSTAGLKDSSYHNALLVVSDGEDTCYMDCTFCLTQPNPFACLLDCEASAETASAAQLAMIAANLRDTYQIRTFVIGFGEGANDTELSAIAENGGTVLGDWILASDVGALTVALQQIIDEMHECNDIII